MTAQSIQIGRNDPCHCGSGKKYKKCHLPIEESEPAGNTLPSDAKADDAGTARDARQPGEVLRPSAKKWADWEDAYADADFPRKAALLQELLAGKDLPEEDTVLVCFEDLWDRAESAGERERIEALMDLLQERHPRVFEAIGFPILEECLVAAIEDGRRDSLAPRFVDYARLAAADFGLYFDDFIALSDRLAYQGWLDTLLGGFREGWAALCEAGGRLTPIAAAMARRGATNEIFAMLEKPNHGPLDLQELHVKISHYEEWPLSSLPDWIARLESGEARWRRGDFAVTRDEWEKNPAAQEPLRDNIQSSIQGFRGFLHREAGYSWSRADLSASAMLEILMERMEGHLKAKPLPKGAPNPWADPCIRVLCPSPDILATHLSRLLNRIPANKYRALSLCEGLPHWLAFLDRMGLVGEEESRPILGSYSALFKEVRENVGNG